MDVMSRCRLFQSSWFTTSASNGRACPTVDRRIPPVARSAHGTATSRARRIAALDCYEEGPPGGTLSASTNHEHQGGPPKC
jgi:hypothetical protein